MVSGVGNIPSEEKFGIPKAASYLPNSKVIEALNREKLKDIKTDRDLRISYANFWKKVLVVQLIVTNGIFILVGCGYLIFEEWTLRLFVSGTLLEIFGIVIIITRYLFPLKTKSPTE